MPSRDAWVWIPFSEQDITDAEREAADRDASAQRAKARAKGGAARTDLAHRTGVFGEDAVAMYLNLPKPRDGWKADLRRGRIDVGKYKIRTRRKPSYDLFLYERERDGTWLLCLTHDMPAGIWLVGWITADEFWQTAQRHQYHGQPFWTVGKDRLHSLSPLNGYGPHAAAWLVDPQTPFWCEVCKGMHPIIEHQRCREAS